MLPAQPLKTLAQFNDQVYRLQLLAHHLYERDGYQNPRSGERLLRVRNVGKEYGRALAASSPAVAAPDQTQLVVVGEHTLGYINPLQPDRAGILHASILRGSPCGRLDGYIRLDGRRVRPAREQDFNDYRVSLEGYRHDPNYHWQRD